MRAVVLFAVVCALSGATPAPSAPHRDEVQEDFVAQQALWSAIDELYFDRCRPPAQVAVRLTWPVEGPPEAVVSIPRGSFEEFGGVAFIALERCITSRLEDVPPPGVRPLQLHAWLGEYRGWQLYPAWMTDLPPAHLSAPADVAAAITEALAAGTPTWQLAHIDFVEAGSDGEFWQWRNSAVWMAAAVPHLRRLLPQMDRCSAAVPRDAPRAYGNWQLDLAVDVAGTRTIASSKALDLSGLEPEGVSLPQTSGPTRLARECFEGLVSGLVLPAPHAPLTTSLGFDQLPPTSLFVTTNGRVDDAPTLLAAHQTVHHMLRWHLKQAIDPQRETLWRCYRRVLKKDPTLSGKVTMRLVIDEDRITSATRIPGEIHSPSLDRCIAKVLDRTAVYSPLGVETTLDFVFRFRPR